MSVAALPSGEAVSAGPTWLGLLDKPTWLVLRRLSSWGLSAEGNCVFHSCREASVLSGRGLQALEAGWTHDERLLAEAG